MCVHYTFICWRTLALVEISPFRQLISGWDWLSLCDVRYLGNGLQDFNLGNDKGLPKRWRLPIYVVARQHYFEQVDNYPLGSLPELRRVLRFEIPPGPLKGPVARRIERLGEQSFRVTRWILDEAALPPLTGKPTLLVPETALLPRDGAVHRFPHRQGELLHFSGPNGLHSALLTRTKEEDHLLEAMGAASAPTTEPNKDKPSRLMNALEAGLRRLPMTELPGFLHFEGTKRVAFPWARAGILVGTLVTTYLVLSSLGLLAQNSYLNYELNRQADAIDAALTVQSNLHAAERHLEERASLMGTGAPGWTLWPVIVDLTQRGMQLNALRFENGEVTVFGEAPRATDLLEYALRHPKSKEAGFIQPVRQGADGESFALRFRPRPLQLEPYPDA